MNSRRTESANIALLIAVTTAALNRDSEHFETDVSEYYRQHLDALIDEGAKRLAMLLGRLPPR